MFSGIMVIYNESAEPKQIKVYPGNTHAQHLFETGVGDQLSERIISLLTTDQPE